MDAKEEFGSGSRSRNNLQLKCLMAVMAMCGLIRDLDFGAQTNH